MRHHTRKQNHTTQASKQPVLTALTIAEARQARKPRVGFERFIDVVAAIAEDYPDEMGSSPIDIDGMKNAVAQYTALQEKHDEAVKQLALINDTRVLYASKAWAVVLTVYRHASVAALTNADLARDLEPFELFMKNGPRKKNGGNPTGGAGPSS